MLLSYHSVLSSLYSSYNSAQLLSFFLLGILSAARGGREIIGLGLYHIFSLLIFYASLKKECTTPVRTTIDIPIFTFLFVCGISAIYSFFTMMRGGIHFATILIHAMNFYSFLRIKEELIDNGELFESSFFHLTVLFSLALSIGILWQLFCGGISTLFFPNKNLLAGFFNCGILILLSFLREDAIFLQPLWKKIIFYAATAVLFLAELSLFSRGALFSLCCALIFLVWWEIKAKRFQLISLIGAGAVLAFLHPNFRDSLHSKILSAPEDSRIVIYQTAWKAFMQKPFFGWGLGSFGQVYEQFKLPIEADIARYEKSTPFAHNEFLELLVETGIVGLGSFLWLIVVLLKTGFCSLKTTDRWCKVAAFSCTISLLTHALLDFNLHLPILAYLLIVCAAILVPSAHLSSPPPSSSPSRGEEEGGGGYHVFKVVLSIWILFSFLTILSELFAVYAGSQKQKGNPERAAQFYRAALFFNPFYAQNFYELAQLSEGNAKEKWLKEAIRWAPENSSFYRDLGLYYLQQGKIEQAIECYQKAIEKNPKQVFYYGELAQTYLWLGQAEPARALFQQAIQLEPLYLLAQQKLGELELRAGNKKLSQKYFLAVKKIQEAKLNPGSDYSKRLLSLK